jgi:type VI secretion system protein VasG
LIRIDVDPDVVAKVVSDWTGIPVGKMQRDQAAMVMNMADILRKRINGQDYALQQIAETIKTAVSGLRDPQQPMGVFLAGRAVGGGQDRDGLVGGRYSVW